MTGDLDGFIDDLLKLLLPADFDRLSEAEQLARAKEALSQLDTRIADLQEEAETPRTAFSRRLVAPDFPALIGEVVIAAAWAEDAAGTVLQAATGDWTVRAQGFDDTSGTLLKHLKSVAPPELVERLKYAMELRHFVVHGFWADGSFVPVSPAGTKYDFVSMKRKWRSEAPEREIKAFTRNALSWLAQEFWEIEEELEEIHSEMLFKRDQEETPRVG